MSGDHSDLTGIPETLRTREQWVNWQAKQRDGKATKIPITPGTDAFASATDPATWASFETAREAVDTGTATGVGFVFTDDDSIVGVDLDDCRDPETGAVDDAAQDIIERLNPYTEVSSSGTGYHVFITGTLPDGRNRRGSIELYDTARFFTVTGDHVDETPTHVARRQDALDAIHGEYVQATDRDGDATQQGTPDGQPPTRDSEVELDDEALLEKAMAASNGAKFERLWHGNTAEYDSQSEADIALCHLLAFWTGGDHTRVDQLFRDSGLFRGKWDEVHYADGATYGEKTIERAIANTSAFYEPESPDESTDSHTGADSSTGGGNPDEANRGQPYLAERNTQLAARVEELETTLERKTERIATLEAENERLKAERAESARDTDRANATHGADADGDDTEGRIVSIRGWITRLFSRRST